jgi:hypothetical protein
MLVFRESVFYKDRKFEYLKITYMIFYPLFNRNKSDTPDLIPYASANSELVKMIIALLSFNWTFFYKFYYRVSQ